MIGPKGQQCVFFVIVQKLVKDTSVEDMVARLGRAPGGVYVSIGIPKEVAFAEADRILAPTSPGWGWR